jgi:hypothetical protein
MKRTFLLFLFLLAPAYADIGIRDPLFRNDASVDYCIISASDTGIVVQARRLAQWKWEQGLRARVVTVDSIQTFGSGTDLQDKIRNFIKIARYNWGAMWVCIAGDFVLIPPRILRAPGDTVDIESDLYYSCLDGDWDANKDGIFGNEKIGKTEYKIVCRFDSRGNYVCDSVVVASPALFELVPDVYIGRLPAASGQEMKILVDKIIAYRSTPHTTASQAGGLILSLQLFNNIGTYADGTYYSEQVYSVLRSTGSDFRSAVIDRIYEDSITPQGAVIPDSIRRTVDEYGLYLSRGYNFVLWNAHGSPRDLEVTGIAPNEYFNTGNAAALQSATFSNMIGEACCALHTERDTCIAKSFLVNPHGGAVSFTGTTTYDYMTVRSRDVQEAFTALCLHKVHYISKAFELALIDQIGTGTWITSREDIYGLQYWGDPEMEIWSRQVSASDTFQIYPENVNGKLRVHIAPAIDSVLVCAYKADGFFSRGYVTNGYADLDPLPVGIEKVKISARFHNYLPSSIVVDDADVGVLQLAGASTVKAPFSARFARGSFFVNVGNTEPGALVTIAVYDLSGRLMDRAAIRGHSQELIMTPSSISTGIYLIKVQAGSHMLASRIKVVR